jgi:hypothetical protein
MTLGIRKLIVLVLVAALFLVANLVLVANWLQEKGVVDWARYVHREYLTGTAITIIVVLLVLLVRILVILVVLAKEELKPKRRSRL